MKVVFTSGYFNPLHIGHINLFKESKGLGDVLVVIVNNDNQVKAKGSTNFMKDLERMEIVREIKCVDRVFLSIDQDRSVCKSLEKLANEYKGNELIFSKGGDRNASNIPETEICKSLNIKIVNGVGGDKVQSSSWLLKAVK